MSRSVSQSLALQASNIVMERLTDKMIERLILVNPSTKDAEEMYKLILQHGHACYKQAEKMFGLVELKQLPPETVNGRLRGR